MRYFLAFIGVLVIVSNVGFGDAEVRAMNFASLLALPVAVLFRPKGLTGRDAYFLSSGLLTGLAGMLVSRTGMYSERLAGELVGIALGAWAINSLAVWAIVRVAGPDWVKGTKNGEPNG